MLYLVKARPTVSEMASFWTLLNNGTIEAQRPDGSEIVASMRRAVMNGDKVEWQETCFCNPPLRHERATIYDQFFTDLETEPLVAQADLKGESFWHYLEDWSKVRATGHGQPTVSVGRYVPIRVF
jgi:hypothetical protein